MTEKRTRVQEWENNGGDLKASLKQRRKLKALYPYMNYSGTDFNKIAFVGMIVMIVFGVIYVINFYRVSTGQYSWDMESNYTPTFTFTPKAALEISPVPMRLEPDLTITPRPTFTPTITLSPTITPTITPSETPTLAPTLTITPVCSHCQSMALKVRIGYFYPPLGGSHCADSLTSCVDSSLANGYDWFLYQGIVAACPNKMPLGSRLEIPGIGNFECAHRLPLANCNFTTGVCDVLVLSASPIIDDWEAVHNALLWFDG